jgi:hypothetical protein
MNGVILNPMEHEITGERDIIRVISYNFTGIYDLLDLPGSQATLEHAPHRMSAKN